MPVVISILALLVIQDHSHRRSGSWDGVTRAGRWDLLTCLALISLGASELAACTGQWPYSLSPLSAAQSQASVSQLASRPTRKHKPPPATGAPTPDAASEVLARTEPAAPMPAPGPTFALSTPASPSSTYAPATNSLPPQSRELVGLDQPEVTRVLGAAAEQFEQPPAMVWRYKNATCELDLFFYLDLRSNRMRTLHYVVKGDGGDPARRQECLESLRVARSD
jgi:hypothetical protein